MGVPASEVGYTSATTGMGVHEVHKGNVVALAQKKLLHVTCDLSGSIVFLHITS
jgi:hypothetical protein